jgi:Protein of unknown function (DUF2846)
MRTYIALPALFMLCVAFPARSQQQSQTAAPATTPAPVEAKLDVDKGKDSTIVFFREHHFTGSALKPSIFVDGKEVDRLANGRWFLVHAEAGKHQIQSSAKNEPATVIETKAGETTFVQMVVVTGNWRGAGRLLQVDSGEGQRIISKLKPLHE